jgi:hypothetical protein
VSSATFALTSLCCSSQLLKFIALELWQFVVTNCTLPICTLPICKSVHVLPVCNTIEFTSVGLCSDWRQVSNTVTQVEANGLNVDRREAFMEGRNGRLSSDGSLDVDKVHWLEMGNLKRWNAKYIGY